MKETPTPPQNAPDIAREAFRRLSMQRTAPTPDAYRTAYNEIAGIAENMGPETVLADFAKSLLRARGEVAEFGSRFNRALEAHDWKDYGDGLSQLIEKRLKKSPPISSTPAYLPTDDN
ncbi:MAG: hypothetical protein ABIT70_04940, partial [Sulfuriferula sp.]